MSDLISREEILKLQYKIADSATLSARNVINAEDVEEMPSVEPEIIRCKDCRWGKEVCGNIECFADSYAPDYHGYEWFCPNGERKGEEE